MRLRVLRDGNGARHRVVDRLVVAMVTMASATALHLDGGRRPSGVVAAYLTIAMVHGPDEAALLLASAAFVLALEVAVAVPKVIGSVAAAVVAARLGISAEVIPGIFVAGAAPAWPAIAVTELLLPALAALALSPDHPARAAAVHPAAAVAETACEAAVARRPAPGFRLPSQWEQRGLRAPRFLRRAGHRPQACSCACADAAGCFCSGPFRGPAGRHHCCQSCQSLRCRNRCQNLLPLLATELPLHSGQTWCVVFPLALQRVETAAAYFCAPRGRWLRRMAGYCETNQTETVSIVDSMMVFSAFPAVKLAVTRLNRPRTPSTAMAASF